LSARPLSRPTLIAPTRRRFVIGTAAPGAAAAFSLRARGPAPAAAWLRRRVRLQPARARAGRSHGRFHLCRSAQRFRLQPARADGAAAGLRNDLLPASISRCLGCIGPGRHLNGIVAGHMSATKTIGVVAAKPIPQVLLNIALFFPGARAVCPTITCQVIFPREWSPAVKAAAATSPLADAGCDVITCHVDGPKGVMETAARRGASLCGNPANQSAIRAARPTVVRSIGTRDARQTSSPKARPRCTSNPGIPPMRKSGNGVVMRPVQLRLPVAAKPEEPARTAARIVELAGRVRRNMATIGLVVSPEWALHGLSMDTNPAIRCRLEGPEVAALRAACKEHRTGLPFDHGAEPCGNPWHAGIVIGDRGDLKLDCRKLHPPGRCSNARSRATAGFR
jgi:hypothetical protein